MQTKPPNKKMIIDTSGLVDVFSSNQSGSLGTLRNALKAGHIRVPADVWEEFKSAYPTFATEAKKLGVKKMRWDVLHNEAAAGLVDSLPGPIGLSPYDRHTDCLAAATAAEENALLITSSTSIDFYAELGACATTTVEKAAALLSQPPASKKTAGRS